MRVFGCGRQSSLLRCVASGLDVQAGAFAASDLQDEPQVVVTISGAPKQPFQDGGAPPPNFPRDFSLPGLQKPG